MESYQSKSLSVIAVIFVLMVHGCNSHSTSSSEFKGQSDPNVVSSEEIKQDIGNENAPRLSKFILGPGDQLEIMVYRSSDLTREVRIGPSGSIMYPLTGDIYAAGLGIFELRDKVREGLSEYIVDPQVTVRILSIQSQKIIVLGEVQSPGFFLAETSMTALEVVSRAAGFTDDAKSRSVLLIRGGMDNPELKVLDLKTALEKGDMSQNVALKGGDILYVPKTKIANVSQFFSYLSTIISPIVSAESAYFIGQRIESGSSAGTSTSVR